MAETDRAEAMRRMAEAFRSFDVEAILGLLTPDAEVLPLRAQLEGKSYVGADGVRELVADLSEDWESVDQSYERLQERGDIVAATGRLQARSNATGVDLDLPIGWVCRFDGDRIAYARAYSDPDQALRAAGFEV